MQECVLLATNNDQNFEGTENLTVQLTTAEGSLAIDPARNRATITILDRDGELPIACTGRPLKLPPSPSGLPPVHPSS